MGHPKLCCSAARTYNPCMLQAARHLGLLALPAIASVLLAGCATVSLDIENGLPWVRHTIDDASEGADGTRLADVNGDGLLDIATGWEEGGRIRVALNPGPSASARRWPAVTVGAVGSPEDAVLVDLDDDGAVDVISSCEGRVRTMWVHWAPTDEAQYFNPSAWQTEPIPASENARQWMFCLPMQIDGQHGIDLVAGAKGDNAQIGWFQAPADPRDLDAWRWHPLYDAGWIMSLVASDMDADGDLDVVASDRRGDTRGCLWLENPGPGLLQTLPWPEHRIGTDDVEVMFLDLADLDRDGLLDVLVAVKGGDFRYYRRRSMRPDAWETHTIGIPEQAGTGKAVRVGDINLDGEPDIVFTCENAKDQSGVMWMAYTNAPTDTTWRAYDISGPEGVKYDLAQLMDLDADGDLDVITCEERTNFGVIWYENPALR